MAENAVEKKTVEKAQEKATVTRFKVENLRKKCMELFGVTTSTFDGAMYASKQTELSVDEARTIIQTWLHGKGGKK